MWLRHMPINIEIPSNPGQLDNNAIKFLLQDNLTTKSTVLPQFGGHVQHVLLVLTRLLQQVTVRLFHVDVARAARQTCLARALYLNFVFVREIHDIVTRSARYSPRSAVP